jgi:phospholipid transport system substrate-binding protein
MNSAIYLLRPAFAFSLLFLFTLGAQAQAQMPEPEALIRKMTSDVLEAVRSDEALAAGDRHKALRLAEEVVFPHVDFRESTRLALGRNWAKASETQRDELVKEFRSMLIRTYSSAIDAYRGQTMQVLPVRMKPADTDVTVRNQFLRPGARPVAVDYAMHKTGDEWKIYDFVIEGVSLVVTYRYEFDSVLRQSDIDGLIRRLAQRNAPRALPAN